MALREETRDSMARQGMAYWRANRERLTEQYPGQYLLIAEQAVRGVFGSRMEADEEGMKQFPDDVYVIRFTATSEHQEPIFMPSFSITRDA